MFKNMKIGLRLGLMSVLLVLLTLVMAFIVFSKIASINLEWQDYQQVTLVKRNAATSSYIALGDGIHHFKNFILMGSDYDKKFMSDIDAVEAGVAVYRATGKLTAEEEASLNAILEGSKSYRNDMAKLQELRGATNTVVIANLDKAVKGADKPIAAALGNLFKMISTTNEEK
jgi:methyl-accepting chemotaxis protein